MAKGEVYELLGDLLFSSSRLVRIAAFETGSTESPATWRTLGVLQSHGSVRLGMLAKLSRVSQPTMTKLVAGLEGRGLVERVTDPDDARAWQIAITTAGADAVDAWREEISHTLHPYFDDIDDADIAVLRRTAQLLQERVERGIKKTLEVRSS